MDSILLEILLLGVGFVGVADSDEGEGNDGFRYGKKFLQAFDVVLSRVDPNPHGTESLVVGGD